MINVNRDGIMKIFFAANIHDDGGGARVAIVNERAMISL